MGLFETKKKKGEDLGIAPALNGHGPHTDAMPVIPPPLPMPKAPPHPEPLAFGIDKAIELMRKLPADNVELVVQVVKTTLESIQVKVSTIIEDAEKKETRLEDRVFTLKREISELEAEIARREEQIEALETDHAETRSVKERLLLAERGMAASAPDEPAPPEEERVEDPAGEESRQ